MSINKPTTFLVFGNLNVDCFDEAGQQIPELQSSVPELLALEVEKLGHDPQGIIIETTQTKWRLFKTEDGGWNREVAK